jgi:hypothetical protein
MIKHKEELIVQYLYGQSATLIVGDRAYAVGPIKVTRGKEAVTNAVDPGCDPWPMSELSTGMIERSGLIEMTWEAEDIVREWCESIVEMQKRDFIATVEAASIQAYGYVDEDIMMYARQAIADKVAVEGLRVAVNDINDAMRVYADQRVCDGRTYWSMNRKARRAGGRHTDRTPGHVSKYEVRKR